MTIETIQELALATGLTTTLIRDVMQDTIIRLGVACDIADAMVEVHSLLADGEEADYVRDNDGRYDIWAFRPDAPEGQMLWRLSVLCGDSDV